MEKPNLFKFATSELSQDAFICWLLAWNHHEEKEAIVAKEFIAFLYNSFIKLAENKKDTAIWKGADYKQITLGGVGDFLNDQMPMQQKFKTDIFFIVKIKERDVAFIIEDKTNTSPHDNQLSRYVEDISKAYKDIPIVRVYYKTGYLFPEDEKDCEKAGYSIISAQNILSFLQKYKIEHEIYQDYMSFIETEYVKAQEDVFVGLQDNTVGTLKKEYAKFEFMKVLAKRCGDNSPLLSHASGVGGNSWAQYRFYRFEDTYGNIGESIFWRIERFKKGYALTLRQYANIKKDKTYSGVKKNRLNIYKASFKTIKGDALEFGRPIMDRTGANSSQIALLHISDRGKNTIQNIYSELPRVHCAFLEEIPSMNLHLLKAE